MHACSGFIADRVNLRYFLSVGMLGKLGCSYIANCYGILLLTGCGVFVGLLGVAYYAEIHHIAYFIVIQIFVGIFEVSIDAW